MKSIRRLYFYLVAFISIEVVLWGLILLLRSMLDDKISGGVDDLAQALALIVVGVPIFLVHWLWTQRASEREEEEKTATLRAVFLYGILIATLIPVVQNLLAFINRSFLGVARLEYYRAFVGGTQTLTDNAVAIAMNLFVAAYFWRVLSNEWRSLPKQENFSEVRRLYRYIWMLYGLLMTVMGAQQILRFVFYIPGNILGELGRETLVNGIALLVVGVPVWVYTWRIIQDALSDPAEMGSMLRLGILYILALGGVITVISVTYNIVHEILLIILGQASTFSKFIDAIGGSLSIGIPLGAIWAYYGHWLDRHITAVGDEVQRAGMKRLYNYILAFIGLVVAFVGVGTLLSFLIDMITSRGFVFGSSDRSTLASALSSLIVGLPLWLMNWRPMQVAALSEGEMGDHARRSLIRKSYVYIALFAGVIGGMATAVGLVNLLLRAVLSGDAASDFVNQLLNMIQLLFLFGVVLIYHFNVLRTDGTSLSDALAEKQSAFGVLIVDSGDGFADSVKAALVKSEAKVQVTVTTPDKKPEGDFKAIIVSGDVAVDAPAWIKSFSGNRIIVQNEAQDIVWADDAAQAAASAQMLAEGQEVQKKKGTRSAWTYVVYVFAVLFALELLFFLLIFSIDMLGGF
ncbi:MAG TPA: DUF5671 domain-containing protein [Anaerolineales bacterium]|nr:DUF5671 domain-containing protein [Anaerolineales bacterium]